MTDFAHFPRAGENDPYGQYLPLISNSTQYSIYFTPLSQNWNIEIVLPYARILACNEKGTQIHK